MSLSNSIWWTRKARIQTEKRLLSNNFHAQFLLFWYSLSSTIAAIYYFQFDPNSDLSGVAWVSMSVLILSASGFINALSFKERASLIKECYITLKTLYEKARAAEINKESYGSIPSDYEKTLEICENHLDIDYYMALCLEYLNHPCPKDSQHGLKPMPNKYAWIMTFKVLTQRLASLTFLYLIPVILFIFLG